MFNITDKIVVVYDLLLFVLLLNQFKFKSTYLKKKKKKLKLKKMCDMCWCYN